MAVITRNGLQERRKGSGGNQTPPPSPRPQRAASAGVPRFLQAQAGGQRRLYYLRSEKNPALHGFADEPSGSSLPPEQGPWRLLRAVTPVNEWTPAADRETVMAAIDLKGFALVERAGELSFAAIPAEPLAGK